MIKNKYKYTKEGGIQMNEKKYKSVVVICGAIILIIQTITLIYMIGINPNGYNQLSKLIASFVAVIMIALIIPYIVLSLDKKKAGPIIGMIAGVINIINFNVVNFFVGIIFIIYCASMLVSINKNTNVQNSKKQEVKENN